MHQSKRIKRNMQQVRKEIGKERRGCHSARSISKVDKEKIEFTLAITLEIVDRLGYKCRQMDLIVHPNFVI